MNDERTYADVEPSDIDLGPVTTGDEANLTLAEALAIAAFGLLVVTAAAAWVVIGPAPLRLEIAPLRLALGLGGVAALLLLVTAVARVARGRLQTGFKDLAAELRQPGMTRAANGVALLLLVVVVVLAALWRAPVLISPPWLALAAVLAAGVILLALLPKAKLPPLPRPAPTPLLFNIGDARPSFTPGEAGEQKVLDDLRLLAGPEPGSIRRPFPVLTEQGLATGQFEVGAVIDGDVLGRFRAANDGVRYQRDPDGFCVGSRTRELYAICRQAEAILARRQVHSALERVNHLTAFVQTSFRYMLDKDSTPGDIGRRCDEYGRYPLESLQDGHGDCECKSMLLASLLVSFGYRTAILPVKVGGDVGDLEGHWAVGVALDELDDLLEASFTVQGASGAKYLYCEPASDRYLGAGVMPSWAVVRIDPAPIELSSGAGNPVATGPPEASAR